MAGLLVNLHDVPKEEEEREWTKDGLGRKLEGREKERESEMMKSETAGGDSILRSPRGQQHEVIFPRGGQVKL